MPRSDSRTEIKEERTWGGWRTEPILRACWNSCKEHSGQEASCRKWKSISFWLFTPPKLDVSCCSCRDKVVPGHFGAAPCVKSKASRQAGKSETPEVPFATCRYFSPKKHLSNLPSVGGEQFRDRKLHHPKLMVWTFLQRAYDPLIDTFPRPIAHSRKMLSILTQVNQHRTKNQQVVLRIFPQSRSPSPGVLRHLGENREKVVRPNDLCPHRTHFGPCGKCCHDIVETFFLQRT